MKKYFILMSGDVCDESDIIQGFIANEIELERLKKTEFNLCFGNMSNDRGCSFASYATVTEITDDEIKVLQKFGVADFSSGYFSEWDDEDNDDDYDYDYDDDDYDYDDDNDDYDYDDDNDE